MDSLIRMDESHIGIASSIAERAMYEDPMMSFLFPDKIGRKQMINSFITWILKFGMNRGEVYSVSSGAMEGFALWMPPEAVENPIWMNFRGADTAISWNQQLRMWTPMEALENARRRNLGFPCWYLMLVVVDPQYKKEDCRCRLIKPLLERIDNFELPCYLETHSSDQVRFYEGLGFKLIEESRIPDTDLDLFPMIKKSSRKSKI